MKLEDVKPGQTIRLIRKTKQEVATYEAVVFSVNGYYIDFETGSCRHFESETDTLELIKDVKPYPEYDAVVLFYKKWYPNTDHAQRAARAPEYNRETIAAVRALAEYWKVENPWG